MHNINYFEKLKDNFKNLRQGSSDKYPVEVLKHATHDLSFVGFDNCNLIINDYKSLCHRKYTRNYGLI